MEKYRPCNCHADQCGNVADDLCSSICCGRQEEEQENEESEWSWMARLDTCVGWVMLVALLYFFGYHPLRALGRWKGWW